MQVTVAVSHLDGPALLWWQKKLQLVREGVTPEVTNLDQLLQEIRQQFTPRDSSRLARDRLAKLVQRGSVTAYTDEFMAITMAIPSITEGEMVDRYVRGLRKGLTGEVETRANMASLHDVIRVAERMDASRHATASTSSWIPRRLPEFTRALVPASSTSPAPVSEAVPMELGATRFQGRCFLCGRFGHRATECRSAKSGRGRGRGQPNTTTRQVNTVVVEELPAEPPSPPAAEIKFLPST